MLTECTLVQYGKSIKIAPTCDVPGKHSDHPFLLAIHTYRYHNWDNNLEILPNPDLYYLKYNISISIFYERWVFIFQSLAFRCAQKIHPIIVTWMAKWISPGIVTFFWWPSVILFAKTIFRGVFPRASKFNTTKNSPVSRRYNFFHNKKNINYFFDFWTNYQSTSGARPSGHFLTLSTASSAKAHAEFRSARGTT